MSSVSTEVSRWKVQFTERQRAAVRLRDSDGLTFREIGLALSVSVERARSLYLRGRQNAWLLGQDGRGEWRDGFAPTAAGDVVIYVCHRRLSVWRAEHAGHRSPWVSTFDTWDDAFAEAGRLRHHETARAYEEMNGTPESQYLWRPITLPQT